LGQDFQATLWIGLDWVSKNGPMSKSDLNGRLYTI